MAAVESRVCRSPWPAKAAMEAAPWARRWRPHFLQTLLLGSMLYAALVLGWAMTNMHSSGSQANSMSMEFETVLEQVQRPMTHVLQKVKDTVEEIRRTPSPEELEAVAHADSVPNLPGGQLQWRNLTCLGWRATSGCKPDGPRVVAKDSSCEEEVPEGSSGYCEVQDANTGESFRVMRRTCASYKKSQVFRCVDAPQFANYHVEAMNAVRDALAAGSAPQCRAKRRSSRWNCHGCVSQAHCQRVRHDPHPARCFGLSVAHRGLVPAG